MRWEHGHLPNPGRCTSQPPESRRSATSSRPTAPALSASAPAAVKTPPPGARACHPPRFSRRHACRRTATPAGAGSRRSGPPPRLQPNRPSPPAQAGPVAATLATKNSSASTVRVNTEKLDSLMDVVGELVIVQKPALGKARAPRSTATEPPPCSATWPRFPAYQRNSSTHGCRCPADDPGQADLSRKMERLRPRSRARLRQEVAFLVTGVGHRSSTARP